MSRRIAVVGTGYVGLIQSVGLADFGNYVAAADVRADVIERLSRGDAPIFELGLSEYLQRNLSSGRVRFTTSIADAVAEAEVVFIAVGTPEKSDGSADLSQIEAAVDSIGDAATGSTLIVTKSTVPVGTNRWIHQRLSDRHHDKSFTVISNPEFLREGRAVHDFFHPDRVVIGFSDPDSDHAHAAKEILEDVYRPLNLISVPFVWTNLETAELIKYASNAFLATKITFINQMANLAEAVGADIHQISRTMGMDGRISPKFLHPGPGYGGSCFPKDTKAVVSTGDVYGVDMSLIRAVVTANDAQKLRTAEKIRRLLGRDGDGLVITVLGVSFKAETDDIRESPAITIVDRLVKWGYRVQVHDPKGLSAFRSLFGDRVHYCEYEIDALSGSDCMVILTEWNAYRNIDFARAREAMRGDLIVDTRNILDPQDAMHAGFRYYGTGR